MSKFVAGMVWVVFLCLSCAWAGDNTEMKIQNLVAVSGKVYVSGVGNFKAGMKQYIDRDYIFDYIPAFLQGATHILTAGNDKFIDEEKPCLSFEVNIPVSVYIVYGDKLRVIPSWLKEFEDTRWKVTRKDSNATTLKGIFTLFRKDFSAGKITLNGNLSKAMANDPEFKKMKGGTFCMYTVVVVPKSSRQE
ncbi:MAG: hypothetical protein PHR77_02345 [Kiritimatiellae bacterium]|nr:hypothetical protein [Kiritimatiellia bacterium]MDD5519877.1 hypothetical protein [Kiritimatiellia bacterium]